MNTTIPPVQTLAEEFVLWTLQHTANLPRNQRHIVGQRLDLAALDVVERVAEARFASRAQRPAILSRLNLTLEKCRVLWRIVLARHWMSEGQSRHVHRLIHEIGTQTGGWLKASRH